MTPHEIMMLGRSINSSQNDNSIWRAFYRASHPSNDGAAFHLRIKDVSGGHTNVEASLKNGIGHLINIDEDARPQVIFNQNNIVSVTIVWD